MESPTNDIRDRLQDTARAIMAALPPNTGFFLLAFDFGDKVGRMEYVSNADRPDIVRLMEEFIGKAKENFMEHEREKLLAGTCNYEISESDRQIIIRALALLAVRRVEWMQDCDRIAAVFHGEKEFEQSKPFTISEDGKSIRCTMCGRTSYNPGDVANLYCGFCHRFHRDR